MPVLEASRVIESLKSASSLVSPGGDVDRRKKLLQVTADEVRAAGSPYTSVYLYMLHGGEELVLEAFSGRTTEHARISVGHGVCGTAVAEGKDQNVGNVTTRENYIACNPFTRSELVVLLRKKDSGEILGQIDIDSDVVDPFSEEEEAALRRVGDALAELL